MPQSNNLFEIVEIIRKMEAEYAEERPWQEEKSIRALSPLWRVRLLPNETTSPPRNSLRPLAVQLAPFREELAPRRHAT